MAMLRRYYQQAPDAPPEQYLYHDDGCEVAPRCLECPLPQCKYDNPRWYQVEMRRRRDQRVLKAHRTRGLSVTQLAHRFAVSERTVHRILRRASKDPAEEVSLG